MMTSNGVIAPSANLPGTSEADFCASLEILRILRNNAEFRRRAPVDRGASALMIPRIRS